jgi:hypothetical protein
MVHLSSGSELCEDAAGLNMYVAMMMVSRTHLEEDTRVPPGPIVKVTGELRNPEMETTLRILFFWTAFLA